MLIARKDKTVTIPVILLNVLNNPVTGMTIANLNDTTGANRIGIVKADGVCASLTLTGSTWTEIDAIRAPGLYHVDLAGADTNQIGSLVLIVRASAGEFRTSYASISVEEYHLASLIAKNSWKIHTTGPDANKLVIYDDDAPVPGTVLMKFNLKDNVDAPSTSSVFERQKV